QLLYFYLSLSSSPSFFLNDTATTEIYTLSLHDALPICCKLSTALTWWVEWNERGALSAPPNLAREGGRLRGGGARRDRTADLLHAMQALSQLSYGPTRGRRNLRTASGLVKLGLSGVSVRRNLAEPQRRPARSAQLSPPR